MSNIAIVLVDGDQRTEVEYLSPLYELSTDQPDTGYDHDVATTTLDAEPCGDVAMGFTPGWVGE